MSDDGFTRLGEGTHQVRVDGDLVILRAFGVTTLEDLDALRELYGRVRSERGSLFVLYDSRAGGGIDRPARKALLEPSAPNTRPNATASFGASFAARTLMAMIDRALSALGKEPFGVAMFATEEEARAYLEHERERLANERAQNP